MDVVEKHNFQQPILKFALHYIIFLKMSIKLISYVTFNICKKYFILRAGKKEKGEQLLIY